MGICCYNHTECISTLCGQMQSFLPSQNVVHGELGFLRLMCRRILCFNATPSLFSRTINFQSNDIFIVV